MVSEEELKKISSFAKSVGVDFIIDDKGFCVSTKEHAEGYWCGHEEEPSNFSDIMKAIDGCRKSRKKES